MDQFAFRAGNLLVENPPGFASLEVTLNGLTLEALASATIAITGADLAPTVDGQPAPQWENFELREGQTLRFTRRVSGCRAYLSVHGGFDAPVFLGSRSTFVKGRMGAPVASGQVLRLAEELPPVGQTYIWPRHARRPVPSGFEIRVTAGPQQDCFTAAGILSFFNSTYRMHPNSDRQGVRTEGPSIEIASGPGIISDPTPLGSIQVPGDGRPIVLHCDGQSTGGYAKIARVIGADLDWFAQMVPGDAIRFSLVSREEALAAWHESYSLTNT
jgi:biotin-dependent carboxylase-like uncharacterized protein